MCNEIENKRDIYLDLSLFVQLCMKGVAIYAEEIDEILEKYPQFAMMLDTVPELAYADDGGIYAQLLCNIGWA